MKREEHLLLLAMFVRQQFLIAKILDVLKTKVLTESEKTVWDKMLRDPAPWDTAFYSRVKVQYMNLAEEFGLEIPTDTLE